MYIYTVITLVVVFCLLGNCINDKERHVERFLSYFLNIFSEINSFF